MAICAVHFDQRARKLGARYRRDCLLRAALTKPANAREHLARDPLRNRLLARARRKLRSDNNAFDVQRLEFALYYF